MLRFRSGYNSRLGLPGIVTRPFLVGCLYWRWLPRWPTRYQPSASTCLMRSRTLGGTRPPSVGRSEPAHEPSEMAGPASSTPAPPPRVSREVGQDVVGAGDQPGATGADEPVRV